MHIFILDKYLSVKYTLLKMSLTNCPPDFMQSLLKKRIDVTFKLKKKEWVNFMRKY